MFLSLSLKISMVQCIENNVSRWEKWFTNKLNGLLLLEQKYFLFLCSFFSVVKKKKKLYISNIENRKQLTASDMHLYFRFRALILLLKGPVLLRQNTHRDQWQPFLFSQFIVSCAYSAGPWSGNWISGAHMGWMAGSKLRHFVPVLCKFIQQQGKEGSSFRREKEKRWILGQAECCKLCLTPLSKFTIFQTCTPVITA